MTKKNISIIIPALLLAVLFFVFVVYLNCPINDSRINYCFIIIAYILINVCIYFLLKIKYELSLGLTGILCLFLIGLLPYILVVFKINDSIVNELKSLKSPIFRKEKQHTKMAEEFIYVVFAGERNGKANQITVNKDIFDKVEVEDTVVFNIGKGILGLPVFLGHEFVFKKQKGINIKRLPWTFYFDGDSIRGVNKQEREKLVNEYLTMTNEELKAKLNLETKWLTEYSMSLIVSTDKDTISKEDKYDCNIIFTNRNDSLLEQNICNFFKHLPENERFDEGLYLLKLYLNNGIPTQFLLQPALQKEDYENLILDNLSGIMPHTSDLNGNLLMNITIDSSYTISEINLIKGLNTKANQIAINYAKTIPWKYIINHKIEDITSIRLIIIYKDGKLRDVKLYDMK